MRVAYVVNSPAGGAAQGLFEFLKAARRYGIVPFLITPKPLSPQLAERLRPLVEDVAVVPMAWWNRNAGVWLPKRMALALAVNLRTRFGVSSLAGVRERIRAWGVHLVHTHSALVPWGAFAARSAGIPHVWHVKEAIGRHGLFKFWLPDVALVGAINRLADRIVAMSRYAASVFEAHGHEVTVVYDGVDLAAFDHAAGAGGPLRDELGIGSEEVLVGMVANVAATMKRHGLFIEVAARLADAWPRARFVLFGADARRGRLDRTASRYAAGLRDRVRIHGLTDRFIWAGFQHDIPQMMDALDVLVHPCPVEGFGRVAIEAMAAGKPVVGPAAGGVAESVVPGETGFLAAPDDAASFASGVEQLLEDPVRRVKMGRRGRRLVEEKFSLDRHAADILAVYDEVLGH